MTPEEILQAAVDQKTPAERAAYLDGACGANAVLRAQVEVLLKAHDRAGSFLEQPLFETLPTQDQAAVQERAGMMIGPYKLLEPIGEGGFGIVFMAEQQKPIRRKVALKVLKPGMDTRQVIARFEAERQALALMDHPNIAHVLDGGQTASGRPYFVMDLVRGIPITEFCDRSHLPVRERLELFVSVCRAVQHAHQKGIIHRDLKPTNVMVTMHDDKAVVKVIDFGIAKAVGQQLTEKTLFTNFAQLIGTPLYMSPEQAQLSGLDVDTRSDLYALGVLLYELLTGTTPFDKERLKTVAYEEMCRIIREEEPPKPSTRISTMSRADATPSVNRRSDPTRLSELCRGELDWIVMKCLEKDRNRRYETANGLARDIEHYLLDEPVLACPPSAWYRLGKFTRRHKGVLIAVTLVLLTLVAGSVVSLCQAIRATQAEGLADLRLEGEKAARHDANAALAAETCAKDRLSRTLQSEQQSLYFQRIARADLEWWNNNVGRADQILDECPPEFRHFEWRYLKHLCHADLVTLSGHTQQVQAVAFSPEGRRLASASLDKSVRIWDLATGKEIFMLEGHSQVVNTVAWSADGRLVASGSGAFTEWRPGEVKIWDATTGQALLNLTGHKYAVGGAAFSPDSKFLASADWDGSVRLWDLTAGQELRTLRGHSSAAKCLAFSPDGQRLASGYHDPVVIIWDVSSGRQLQTLRGHDGDVLSVAFSPNGHRLVSGSWDHTVRLWDLTRGAVLLSRIQHSDVVWGVAFSPDGQRLASGCNDGSVKVWDAESRQELATLRGHSGHVCGVAFSPGGRCLASASWDHTVKVWDLTADQQGRSFEGYGCQRLAISPDGQHIAFGNLVPPSHWVVGRLSIYDVRTGRAIRTLGQRYGGFHGAAFSPDGQHLAADWDTTVKIWEAQTGREVFTLVGHRGPVTHVAFSPDSQHLASASEDKTVKLWDARAGKELLVLAGHTGPVTSVAFSPDGQRLASASNDHCVKIWDVITGRELSTLKGHNAPVTQLAFSRLGEHMASASEDRTVRVWDSQTWKAILMLPGHTGTVTAVSFSPDGRRLVSGSLDGSVRVWDAVTGHEALTLRRQFSDVHGVAFTPDGERLVASGPILTLGWGFKVWDAREPNQNRQSARDEVFKADTQQAWYLRGKLYAGLRRWDQAVVAYTRAIALGLSDAQAWYERGTAYGMLAKYERAAADFARAITAKPDDPYLWYCHALARLGADDLEGYRQVCAGIRERFGKTKDAVSAGYLVFTCCVVAARGCGTAEFVSWSKIARSYTDWARVQAHALYRDGQYEAAVRHLHEWAKTHPLRGDDFLFLAMAQQQIGKADEARKTFDQAVNWIEDSTRFAASGGLWYWNEQVGVRYLRREAEMLLKVK